MRLILSGSLDALTRLEVAPGPVVVIATAAAFIGVDHAVALVRDVADQWGEFSVWPVTNRASAHDPALLLAVAQATTTILLDGAPLHGRSVWRQSALAEVWATSLGSLIAVGSVCSVLGEVMIDPRGGAPTTGVGLYGGVVVTPRLADGLRERTRQLLGTQLPLVELGPLGLVSFDKTWTIISGDLEGRDSLGLSDGN